MGWASTADYMQAASLKFKTKEAAIHFCEKQGWPVINISAISFRDDFDVEW